MVCQREVGGKISSPHSIKYFGDQNPPKMGRCEMNWIIILFFTHIDAFGVEKVWESTHLTIFTDGAQFGETRSKTLWECFNAPNDFLGILFFPIQYYTLSCYSIDKYLSNDTRSVSIESVCKSYATQKLTFLFSHLQFERMPLQPQLFMGKGLAT